MAAATLDAPKEPDVTLRMSHSEARRLWILLAHVNVYGGTKIVLDSDSGSILPEDLGNIDEDIHGALSSVLVK